VRLAFACSPLDVLLGGGVESGAITELYGEAASGKTNACLQLARNVARAGRKVAFIDTEGVSVERLAQMCEGDAEAVRRGILFFEPFSLREQEQVVEKAARLAASSPEVGLIVLDSATLHYRVTLSGTDGVRERRALAAQLQLLASVARKRDLPVVITNQVYTDIETDLLEPVGGQLVRHITKAVVRFEKVSPGLRRAVIVKHRSLPEGADALFRIEERGLVPDGAGARFAPRDSARDPAPTPGADVLMPSPLHTSPGREPTP
jgi:DNA repair protein RadB